mgnify:CR=1 FL=1
MVWEDLKPSDILTQKSVERTAMSWALREHWTWDGTAWRREATAFPFAPGAGFDVLSQEPPPPDNVLLNLRLPNFLLTPHSAWASAEAMQGLADQLTGNIEAFAGGEPVNVVA